MQRNRNVQIIKYILLQRHKSKP